MKTKEESDYETLFGTLNTLFGTPEHTFRDLKHLLTIQKVLVTSLVWDMQ